MTNDHILLAPLQAPRVVMKKYVSSRELRIRAQFWHPMDGVECLECVTSLVTKVTQRSFVFKHLYQYCIVVDTKGLVLLSICVNIVLFSTQRSFIFKHLCKYYIVGMSHDV